MDAIGALTGFGTVVVALPAGFWEQRQTGEFVAKFYENLGTYLGGRLGRKGTRDGDGDDGGRWICWKFSSLRVGW